MSSYKKHKSFFRMGVYLSTLIFHLLYIHKMRLVLECPRFAYRNIYLESIYLFFTSMIIFKQRNFYQHSTLPLSLSDSHVFPYKVVMQQTLEEGHLCKSNISILTTAFPCSFLVFKIEC